jgi:hypothetical protein
LEDGSTRPRPFSVLDPSVKISMVVSGSELGVVKLFNSNRHSKMGEVVNRILSKMFEFGMFRERASCLSQNI